MTEQTLNQLQRYAEIIVAGKPEPPTQLEKDAWAANNDFLNGKTPKMDLDEADRIMKAYLAKPNMTAQQWLDLEKEVNQFLAERVNCYDPMYRPHAHTIGVLYKMCEAIRLTQAEEKSNT